MKPARDPIFTQFSERVAIETPEHVDLELELAGLGSRTAAAIVDVLILGVLYIVLGVAGSAAEGGLELRGWIAAANIALGFAFTWGYFLLFEALNAGRTPGKLALGIRVVLETGHPVTFAAAAIRNILRLIDAGALPFIGMAMVLLHPQHKRLGDIAAGTIVIRDRPADVTLARGSAPDAGAPLESGAPVLDDSEYKLLGQVLERLDSLEPTRRATFVAGLAARFAARFPQRDPDAETFLTTVYNEERERRRGRLGARVAAPGRTALSAERFVARKQDGWERFRADAAGVERKGLKSLGAEALLAFAARYREVAADLARARTYGADSRILEYLERVVATGHNAVYGLRSFRRPRLVDLLIRDLPAAVFAGRAYVLTAAALFAVPALVGYLLLHERPEIASQVLPDEMIARAEAGASQHAGGVGYAQAPSPYLPIMATGIIANNVQVAFAAFAFGITGGVGTVVLLVLNGLFFGAVLALFAQYHLAGWLLTFVAGHGVLELTAIYIAGGAGLLVAHALLAPGDLTRHDALIIRGRLAIRLVGASASLLILAGCIEGFLSGSDAPPALKFAVSALSALLLALYFANGRRALGASTVKPASRGGRPAEPPQSGRRRTAPVGTPPA